MSNRAVSREAAVTSGRAYAAIVVAFPPAVEVTRRTDHLGELVEFRIAAEARITVASEVDRIGRLIGDRAWVRFLGPYHFGDEWICHGIIRERLDA